MSAASSSGLNVGPVLKVMDKRIKKYVKILSRIVNIEEAINEKGKSSINEEQEQLLSSKPSVQAIIPELQTLRGLISAALEEEDAASDPVSISDNAGAAVEDSDTGVPVPISVPARISYAEMLIKNQNLGKRGISQIADDMIERTAKFLYKEHKSRQQEGHRIGAFSDYKSQFLIVNWDTIDPNMHSHVYHRIHPNPNYLTCYHVDKDLKVMFYEPYKEKFEDAIRVLRDDREIHPIMQLSVPLPPDAAVGLEEEQIVHYIPEVFRSYTRQLITYLQSIHEDNMYTNGRFKISDIVMTKDGIPVFYQLPLQRVSGKGNRDKRAQADFTCLSHLLAAIFNGCPDSNSIPYDMFRLGELMQEVDRRPLLQKHCALLNHRDRLRFLEDIIQKFDKSVEAEIRLAYQKVTSWKWKNSITENFGHFRAILNYQIEGAGKAKDAEKAKDVENYNNSIPSLFRYIRNVIVHIREHDSDSQFNDRLLDSTLMHLFGYSICELYEHMDSIKLDKHPRRNLLSYIYH